MTVNQDTEYRITYQDSRPRPDGTRAPELNDYLHLSSLSQRVYALIASGYVITRIEGTDS
jgi:hypothetical protein